MKKYIYLIKYLFTNDPLCKAMYKWCNDNGDETLRLDYPLDEGSLVLDVGGYRGEWSKRIYKKYGCKIMIFEPVREFYELIKSEFGNSSLIKIFNYGLSDSEVVREIYLKDDGSSIYESSSKNKMQVIRLRSIENVIEEENITFIDLVKINIEGGEFSLLKKMIESGIVHKCANIQIQFHRFVDRSEEMRNEIIRELSKTHTLTYEYYFIWENWKRREN